jgi:hypothetical protein
MITENKLPGEFFIQEIFSSNLAYSSGVLLIMPSSRSRNAEEFVTSETLPTRSAPAPAGLSQNETWQWSFNLRAEFST